MSEFASQKMQPNKFSSDSWVVLSPIEQSIKSKIERIGKPLKDWDISINYGIKTGFNEAFIIDENTKDELIKKSPKSAEVIRPILRGRDIKRYKADFADLWLLNIHNGTNTIPPVDINDYPEVKAHLDQFYPALEKRQDKGVTPYNLRSCIYTDDFSKQKIVWAELARTGNAFTFDDSGAVVLNTCYILTFETQNLSSIKSLLVLLNSKLTLFYMNLISSKLDETGWRWLKQFVEILPMAFVNNGSELEVLVDEMIALNKDGPSIENQEDRANAIIYDIYGLTEEEIAFIDSL